MQFQCLFYSFLFGFVMSGAYHIINRIFLRISRIFRVLIQVILGVSFGMIYFYGLVVLNKGILRLYFFVLIFIGYLFYQKYYAYYLLYYLEIFIRFLKRILSPFFFFFKKINVIIQKRVRRVRLKWQKNNQNIKNS